MRIECIYQHLRVQINNLANECEETNIHADEISKLLYCDFYYTAINDILSYLILKRIADLAIQKDIPPHPQESNGPCLTLKFSANTCTLELLKLQYILGGCDS